MFFVCIIFELFICITRLCTVLHVVNIGMLFQVRPPQPSVYYFVVDVSYNAIETGAVCVCVCVCVCCVYASEEVCYCAYHV